MSNLATLDVKRYERERRKIVEDAYERIRDAVYVEGTTNAERSAILSLVQHELNQDLLSEIRGEE